MKSIILFLLSLCFSVNCLGQLSVEPFIGTWQYCNGDSVFTIKLQKGKKEFLGNMVDAVYGGYSLSVNGVVVEDYLRDVTITNEEDPNMFICAFLRSTKEKYLPVTFYDQRKKHMNGRGIFGGLKILPSGQLHWYLNEKESLFLIYENKYEPIGCSIPTDVLMNKIE